MLAEGLSRTAFLITQIEAAATVPDVATAVPVGNSRTRYQRRRSWFRAPGFCYAKLFGDEWAAPAVCVLGPYPAAADVARLAGYYSQAAQDGHYAVAMTGTRGGRSVAHVQGMDSPPPPPGPRRSRTRSGEPATRW